PGGGWGGRGVARPPSMQTSPASGATKPAMLRSAGVLPQPDGPSRVKNSPAATWSEKSSSARTAPYCLVTPRNSTSVGSVSERTTRDVSGVVRAPAPPAQPVVGGGLGEGRRRSTAVRGL